MNGIVERWLGFAHEDLQVARMALQEGFYNAACFHAQQCAEKVLKGLLAWQGMTPPRIHSIADLLQLLPENRLTDLRDKLSILDVFYIPTRYPDALPGTLPEGLPGRAEAEEAVSLAQEILKQAGRWISE